MNNMSLNPTETDSTGKFDSDRAAQLRSQILDAFQSRNRKIGRITAAYLLVLIFMAWLCLHLFFNTSNNVQLWILYAVLFLVMFEGTILIKLWYWVVTSQLGILREIKVLRMDMGLQKGSMEVLEEVARMESPVRSGEVSKWERYIWRTAILLVSTLLGLEIGLRVAMGVVGITWGDWMGIK